jgi:hypothetical protein
MNKSIFILIICLLTISFSCSLEKEAKNYDVIVLGEGTGAITAAIQSARSGAKTLLVNPINWLGGMLSSAGVSATDGNHKLPSGMWGEFQQYVRNHYGGVDSVFTGWVSNTMFHPKIGHRFFSEMAFKEPNLTIYENSIWTNIEKGKNWKIQLQVSFEEEILSETVFAKILIDGTDLGDVAAQVGATYDLGMDAREKTGEAMAPEKENDIIQDLTYVAIVTDLGQGTDHTIPKPANYDPAEFQCCCRHNCEKEGVLDCEKMLTYGKLPGNKYMLNWPKVGNDYYANVVEMSREERTPFFEEARQKTLRYIYYIQHELGYKHLGLTYDDFPTDHGLAIMPYHREGRRIHSLTRLNVNHILNPYDFEVYKTGIAVGDYPIDHHHAENPDAPEIDFPPVPSFNVPMGCLIPKNVDNLLVADKAISVTNIVNGSSRLQPVIIQIGQAAGLMGAIAAQKGISPKELNIRAIQDSLISNNGYVMPFIDVMPDNPHFAAVQRVGATGILKGTGIPFQWANQTWFYPDSLVTAYDFQHGLSDFDEKWIVGIDSDLPLPLPIMNAIGGLKKFNELIGGNNTIFDNIDSKWESEFGLNNFDEKRPITRVELAVLLDKTINPFQKQKVNF